MDKPGTPFPSCLVGISCLSMSDAGRTSLRSPLLAMLLCILSVKDVCKWDCSKPHLTFPWVCVCQSSMPNPSERNDTKLLLGRVERPTLYTWPHANQSTIEIPAE